MHVYCILCNIKDMASFLALYKFNLNKKFYFKLHVFKLPFRTFSSNNPIPFHPPSPLNGILYNCLASGVKENTPSLQHFIMREVQYPVLILGVYYQPNYFFFAPSLTNVEISLFGETCPLYITRLIVARANSMFSTYLTNTAVGRRN